MTTFPTSGPISATIDLGLGDIRVAVGASDAAVVEVAPTDPTREKDRRAAEATTVTYADGRLRIAGPRSNVLLGKKVGSVQVSVTFPARSDLDVTTALGATEVDGAVGSCRVKSSAGDIRLSDAASAHLTTAMGAIVAHDITGDVYCSTGSGSVQIDRVGGPAEVRNSNGDSRIGESAAGLRVKAANGDVTVDRARGDLVATTSNGSLRVGSAESGTVQLTSSLGRIHVGIPAGTAALLDLRTSLGKVRSELDASDQPASGDRAVEVHAQTSAGDIDIVRVPAAQG